MNNGSLAMGEMDHFPQMVHLEWIKLSIQFTFDKVDLFDSVVQQ